MELSTEVHFAQRLASNQLKIREKALQKVSRWLASKSTNKDAFTEDNLLKLWKGLFYYFWHTDKPLVQEEKADVLSNYIHVFRTAECAFLYIDTFFQTMAREWLAIDRYRLEKFMMLIRKFLHETFQLLKKLKWKLKWIKHFRRVMKKTVTSSVSESTPVGLKMHITDIYMEELAKVGADELTSEVVHEFLVPYCRILLGSDDFAKLENTANKYLVAFKNQIFVQMQKKRKEKFLIFLNSVKKDVFLYLINQDADEDLFHEFPILNFDANAVQSLVMKYANKPGVRKPNMKIMYGIIKQYEDYKNGVSSVDRILSDKSKGRKLKKRDIERSALKSFEDEVSYSEEKKRVKKRKLKEEENIIDL